MSETPYLETELLLAVMKEDDERATELVEGMTAHERNALRGYLSIAASWVNDVCADCGKVIDTRADLVTVRALFGGSREVYHAAHVPARPVINRVNGSGRL